MTVRCSQCANFSLKGQPLSNVGLYNCAVMPKWQYPSPFCERECKDFRQAPPEQSAARLQFESQGVNHG